MHHQPTTQTTTLLHPPSATALHPIPCISSDCLRHPLLRVPPLPHPPRHPATPVLASRLVSWYPTLHFSSTLRAHPLHPWHRRRARSPAATTTFLCTLHRADTLGVLNGIVATLLLATSKCRRRRLRRRRRQRSAVPSLITFLPLSLSLSFSSPSFVSTDRFGKWKCYSIDGIFAFFTFDDAQ